MKKLYMFLLAGATAFGMNAANLKFYVGSQEVTPGSTVYFTDYQAEEYDRGVWDIVMNPHVSIESDFFSSTVNVTATCTSGQEIQMCAGGQCAAGNSVTKENLTIHTGERLELDFEYMNHEYEGDDVPTVTTSFKATDGEGSPVEFILVMGPKDTSVNAVGVSTYIRYTGAGIAYSVDNACNFALYSLTGSCVAQARIEGSGVVSTNGLPKGVYIYKAGARTGKILIK